MSLIRQSNLEVGRIEACCCCIFLKPFLNFGEGVVNGQQTHSHPQRTFSYFKNPRYPLEPWIVAHNFFVSLQECDATQIFRLAVVWLSKLPPIPHLISHLFYCLIRYHQLTLYYQTWHLYHSCQFLNHNENDLFHPHYRGAWGRWEMIILRKKYWITMTMKKVMLLQ